jgi:gamma-glutamylcyclotransferase (GGCT)/AIG2-like uncharacterized protein YtfP
MNNRNLIGAYGSLKTGFYNHGRCGEQIPAGETTVRGYMTLIHNSYPQLFLDDSEVEHEIELFIVDDLTLQQIHYMELGAGYEAVNISTPHREATIWVFTDKSKMRGRPIKAYTHEELENYSD